MILEIIGILFVFGLIGMLVIARLFPDNKQALITAAFSFFNALVMIAWGVVLLTNGYVLLVIVAALLACGFGYIGKTLAGGSSG